MLTFTVIRNSLCWILFFACGLFFLTESTDSINGTTSIPDATVTTTQYGTSSMIFGCDAAYSIVTVTTAESIIVTLTSAAASFPPYDYNVSSFPVVIISANQSCYGINANLSGKIAMVWRTTDSSSCSDKYKVLNAQNAGAVAVLVANNQGVNIVEMIRDDNTSTNPVIPSRMITQEDGWQIDSYIESGDYITVEFGCSNSEEYPTSICVGDTSSSGTLWYLAGDYQLQIETYNDAPVYEKESYLGVLPAVYLYQDKNSTNSVWRFSWSLGDASSTTGYCESTSNNPITCTPWYTTPYETTNFSLNTHFNLSSSVCQTSNSYYCISSSSCIGGLTGTYRKLNSGLALWVRELTGSDMEAGYLYYTAVDDRQPPMYQFQFVQSIGGDVEAYCSPNPRTANASQYPQNGSPWYIKDSYTYEYSADDTFSIVNTTCSGYGSDPDTVVQSIPETFCLQDEDGYHGFLEGTYYLYPNETTSNGYPVYVQANADDPAYVWYYQDADNYYHLWVIANTTPSQDSWGLYAYCAAYVEIPTLCEAKWNFYYDGDFSADCSAIWAEGACNTTQSSDTVICVFTSDVNVEAPFLGTYDIGSQHNGKNYWILQNTFGESYYLWYDSDNYYWYLGTSFTSTDGILSCGNATNYDNPIDCPNWVMFNGLPSIFGFNNSECTSTFGTTPLPSFMTTFIRLTTTKEDNNGADTQTSNNGRSTTIALSVVLPLIAVFICIAAFLYYKKKQSYVFDATNDQNRNNNPTAKPQHRKLDSKSLELHDTNNFTDEPKNTGESTATNDTTMATTASINPFEEHATGDDDHGENSVITDKDSQNVAYPKI